MSHSVRYGRLDAVHDRNCRWSNYVRNDSADDTVVTVSRGVSGLVTGGGNILLTSSAGRLAGDVGTKNNFGFNIKTEKNGTKGNINVLVRRLESDGILHTYQIKGND